MHQPQLVLGQYALEKGFLLVNNNTFDEGVRAALDAAVVSENAAYSEDPFERSGKCQVWRLWVRGVAYLHGMVVFVIYRVGGFFDSVRKLVKVLHDECLLLDDQSVFWGHKVTKGVIVGVNESATGILSMDIMSVSSASSVGWLPEETENLGELGVATAGENYPSCSFELFQPPRCLPSPTAIKKTSWKGSTVSSVSDEVDWW
ncbi:hypothetical protein K470DRAFT_262203 [Piedraia hortae CBS 480.64]|uniref:Uncharacterized protein n=1 Tax=Piedraia hortae CBS 480.64 TaxID=1314780 RepID=A0A6A7C8A0_9PEZI|nr:hypothetical protein K470DRAFT_262203 [Piedraia hortae CBS 480.64]